MSEYFIGLISGTSVDAIDAVLMDFSKSNTHIVTSYSQPINNNLKNAIQSAISKNTWPQETEGLDLQFADESVKAVKHLLSQASLNAAQINAIGSHGQTIWHDPDGDPPISIQVGNAQHIANQASITTIGNFRQADMDAGGQGAPLACTYHAEVLCDLNENRVILNLGGIANITFLPKDSSKDIIGFDTGPANTLLDAWIKRHKNLDYDKDSTWAKTGKVNQELLNLFLTDKYFKENPPKSTGREKFNLHWLQRMLDQYQKPISEHDVQATLLILTTRSVANAIKKWVPETSRVLLCGGGSNNSFLISQLQKELPNISVEQTSLYGVSENWMEAMCFAWLAKQKIENRPGNTPSVTGATKKIVLGDCYKPI